MDLASSIASAARKMSTTTGSNRSTADRAARLLILVPNRSMGLAGHQAARNFWSGGAHRSRRRPSMRYGHRAAMIQAFDPEPIHHIFPTATKNVFLQFAH